jgi:hypothetical protein
VRRCALAAAAAVIVIVAVHAVASPFMAAQSVACSVDKAVNFICTAP